MSAQMDERFAVALRELLVAEVQQPQRGRRWPARRRRWAAGTGVGLVLAATGGGIAYAAGVFRGLPGSPRVSTLAPPVTVTGTGSQVIDLGLAPARATAITIRFSCLTAGTFTFADGAQMACTSAASQSPAFTTIPVRRSQDSTTITTTPGARWRLTATYASVSTPPWAVNAHGQTYGVQNRHGTPDLIAVIATNHRTGYVYASQLNPPSPKTPAQAIAQNTAGPRRLTVYASDGRTPIGKFDAGN